MVHVSSSRRSFSPAAELPRIGGLTSMQPPQLPPPQLSLPQLAPLRSVQWGWRVPLKADIDAKRRRGQELDQQGKFDNAEQEYRDIVDSLRRLYSPTHPETSAAAYDLADFYARYKRMDEADKVLDRIGEEHDKAFGQAHPKTIEHAFRVAKLFEKWLRTSDASARFSRVLEYVRRLLPENIESLDSEEGVVELQDETVETSVSCNDQLDRAGNEQVEQLLRQIIEECEKRPSRLSAQLLKTRSLHLDICRHLKDEERLTSSLNQAQGAITKALSSQEPTKSSLLLPSFELIGRFVQNDHLLAADTMFRKMERLLTKRVDEVNEHTICFMAGVGKVLENHSWKLARTHFERALAATMSRHVGKCKCAKRLEVTLSERRLAVSLPSDHQWPYRNGRECSLGRRLLRLSQLETLSSLADEIFGD